MIFVDIFVKIYEHHASSWDRKVSQIYILYTLYNTVYVKKVASVLIL
jgi:hypothetical protein